MDTQTSERLSRVMKEWFLKEPFLFLVCCTHQLSENSNLHIPFRSGNKTLEYSPAALRKITDSEMQEFLTLEVFRIALNHPYKPLSASREISYVESTNMCLKLFKHTMRARDFARRLNVREGTELWREDTLAAEETRQTVEDISAKGKWGNVSSDAQMFIKNALASKNSACTEIVAAFKTSVLSGRRFLTRMRPNRRYGFSALGSRRTTIPQLLLAVDTSGSIGEDTLQQFFSIINMFFSHGIDKIDVIQFDTKIKGKPRSFRRAKSEICFQGGGGTNFQCVFDFILSHNIYDGVILLTDGYAPVPVVSPFIRAHILFLFTSEEEQKLHKVWTEKIPRCTTSFISARKNAGGKKR